MSKLHYSHADRLEMAYGALGGPVRQFADSERESLVADLESVLAAESDEDAGAVIEWWGFQEFEEKLRGAIAWARRFRDVYRRLGDDHASC